jgi:hypothetical protein
MDGFTKYAPKPDEKAGQAAMRVPIWNRDAKRLRG